MSARRIVTAGLMAATIAVAALAGTTAQSRAGSLSPAEAAAIAGLGGFIVGGVVANAQKPQYYPPQPQPQPVVASPWQRHVALCQANYISYDVASDSYMGYDGYRRPCNLW